MTDITLEAIRDRALAIAESRPDFVYVAPTYEDEDGAEFDGDCVYLDSEGAPSCLFGHALVDLGVDKKWIERNEDQTISRLAANLLNLPRDGSNYPNRDLLTERQSWLLYRMDVAQNVQDMQKPWGEAAAVLRDTEDND